MIRALRPIIVKEFRQIWRDPTSLGMLMVVPAGLIILVGYAMNFDVKHIPLAIFDQSKTVESRNLLEKFDQSEYFDHKFDVFAYAEIEDRFMNGDAKVALVVPTNFGRDVLAGREAQVQVLVDGSDANTAGQAVGYATRIIAEYSSRFVTEEFQKAGREQYVPIDFQPRIWYNPDLVTSQFLLPGLIGFIIVLTAVISTSMTVVREKERGTMEQLMVSPLRPAEIILGKTIPYVFVALVTATLILVLGYALFDVVVRGSLLVLYAGILVVIIGALGQGLLISTVTDSQQVAFMLSVFSSLLPSMLLSGFVFPIASMPIILQVLSNIAVNKFFLIFVRGVMLKGVGLGVVWPQFLAILAFAVVTLGISVKRMQKRTL